MPTRPCPCCERETPRWLEASSKNAFVNYHRCDICGCVWTLPKDDPDAAPTIVAEGRKPE